MHKSHDIELTAVEDHCFKGSFKPAVTSRRQRQILMFGIPALFTPWVVGYLSQSWLLVAGLTTLYMAITILEKIAYGNGVLAYKSVIRKLSTQLEEGESVGLESHNQPLQPNGASPDR